MMINNNNLYAVVIVDHLTDLLFCQKHHQLFLVKVLSISKGLKNSKLKEKKKENNNTKEKTNRVEEQTLRLENTMNQQGETLTTNRDVSPYELS